MEYSFLFPLMQKNYENWSRNARLIVEKLLASFFSDTVYTAQDRRAMHDSYCEHSEFVAVFVF